MRRLVSLTAFALTLVAAPAAASTITFDEFDLAPNSTLSIASPYQGFTWSNFSAMDPGSAAVGSGYENGTVSQENVAFNFAGNPASFSAAAPFTLNSLYMSAAWNDQMTVRVLGRLGGVNVFSMSLLVDHTGPNLFVFNWSGIDEVLFESSGGIDVPELNGLGRQFAIDNLRVNELAAVPEPGTVVLFGTGVAALAYRLRRRRA
jgi:hypothetical protein